MHVDGPLRPARRAARVADEQGVLAVERRRVDRRSRPDRPRPPTGDPGPASWASPRSGSRCHTSTCRIDPADSTARSAIGFIGIGHALAAGTRSRPRGPRTPRRRSRAATASGPKPLKIGTQTAPSFEHAITRGHRLDRHRHEDPDPVAGADPEARERARDGVGQAAQLGEGRGPHLAVLGLPDHGRSPPGRARPTGRRIGVRGSSDRRRTRSPIRARATRPRPARTVSRTRGRGRARRRPRTRPAPRPTGAVSSAKRLDAVRPHQPRDVRVLDGVLDRGARRTRRRVRSSRELPRQLRARSASVGSRSCRRRSCRASRRAGAGRPGSRADVARPAERLDRLERDLDRALGRVQQARRRRGGRCRAARSGRSRSATR